VTCAPGQLFVTSRQESPDQTNQKQKKSEMHSRIGRANVIDPSKNTPVGGAPQQNPEWLAAVLTASRDGIVIETNERIVEINNACVRLLGYANASELVGRSVEVFCAPGGKPLLELGHQGSTDGSPDVFEFVGRKKDGTTVQLEATTKLVGGSCRIVILRDSAMRTETEARKLEGAGRLPEGFAHDLNNLLTAIRCQTELVLVYQTVPPTVREILQKVIAATERATQLTRSLRAAPRSQAMQLLTLDLNLLIANLAKMPRQVIGDGVELRLDLASDLPQVHADAGMVEQVILELAATARKAMPQGGILTLATAVFHADDDYLRQQPAARSGDFVMLTVKIANCVIVPEQSPRMFGPSISVEASGPGNGSGLAKVFLDGIQQHQGWLEVESRAGQGTCFRIYLPACRDLASASTCSRKPAATGGKETLLVVADDLQLRQLIRLTLQKLGYQVLEASSGGESLQVWESRASDIQLTLVEMFMPEGLTGYELIKRLRAKKPELKAIVMSDSAIKMPAADIELLRGARVLFKPFDPVSLAHMIRSCLDETPGAAGGA
jgi:two-component system cell cycle sensor histidine kinase/response regulator CckA